MIGEIENRSSHLQAVSSELSLAYWKSGDHTKSSNTLVLALTVCFNFLFNLQIKADVETQGEFVKSLIKEVTSAAYKDIEDVVAFVKWLDDELGFLVCLLQSD